MTKSRQSLFSKLYLVLAGLVIVSLTACNLPLGEKTPSTLTPEVPTVEIQAIDESTPVPTATAQPQLSAFQQYVANLRTQNKAPASTPNLVDDQNKEDGAKQQIKYFRDVFQKAAKDKRLNTLTAKAAFAQRGALSGEKVAHNLVIQHVDGMAASFVLTQEKGGMHAYFVDPQGPTFELYLIAQSKDGETYFERDINKAATLLERTDITSIQWVTVRSFNKDDFALLSADQKSFLNAQYGTLYGADASLEGAISKAGSAWVILPVVSWDAPTAQTAILLNPSNLSVHLEDNPAYKTAETDRGTLVGLPLGKIPAGLQPKVIPTATKTSVPTQTPKPVKPSKTPKPGKTTATPTGAPTLDADLQSTMDQFTEGETPISNSDYFSSMQGISPLGVADEREIGINWGFYVQGIYLGTIEANVTGAPAAVRFVIMGFTDQVGNRYVIPFQLGVDINHSIIVQYDPNRTLSAIDNERPITMSVAESDSILRANLSKPVLFFLMRAAPPFPLSESDSYYGHAHEVQYPVAEQALRFIRTAATGDIKQMQPPSYVNTLKIQGKTLPLIENIILPIKP